MKADPFTEPDDLEVEFKADQLKFNADGHDVEPRIVGGREANPRKSYFLMDRFPLLFEGDTFLKNLKLQIPKPLF